MQSYVFSKQQQINMNIEYEGSFLAHFYYQGGFRHVEGLKYGGRMG